MVKNRHGGFTFLFCLLLFCVAAPFATAQIGDTEVQRIQCKSDTSIAYALYVPGGKASDLSRPLLIFLDPAARGDMPVKMYREIADRNNVILAGSFSSRNFDPASSVNAVPAILQDIKQRCPINDSAVWLGGFSGGSRMASAYAAMDERITGVIACGAGFASLAQTDAREFYMVRRQIPYAALVGDKDMNFEEMTTVAELLATRQKQHLLLTFRGEHIWPPAVQMEMAVLWQLQQSATAQKNSVDSLQAKLTAQYQQYTTEGLLYFAWLTADAARKIPSLSAWGDSLATVAVKSKQFGRHKAQFETTLEEERSFMDQFSFVFNQVVSIDKVQADNDELWKQKTGQISAWRKDKDPYRQLSGQRVYDICWRLCSEQYGWYMETKRYKQAYSVSYILGFFEVPGVNAEYRMARAAAAMGNKELCISHLKKAVKKGNLTRERILQDEFILTVMDAEAVGRLF